MKSLAKNKIIKLLSITLVAGAVFTSTAAKAEPPEIVLDTLDFFCHIGICPSFDPTLESILVDSDDEFGQMFVNKRQDFRLRKELDEALLEGDITKEKYELGLYRLNHRTTVIEEKEKKVVTEPSPSFLD
jgi:hypothetical protein